MPEIRISPIVEKDGPPIPPRKKYERARMVIAFWEIPVGGSGRFPRAAGTVLNRMYQYLKTPQGQGQHFVVRPISEKSCRVWRIR